MDPKNPSYFSISSNIDYDLDDQVTADVNLNNVKLNTLSASEQEKEDERMWQGVQAFFCNRYTEAQEIFAEKADIDPLYALGQGCISFLKAVTTFNEQDIAIAIKQLVSAESLASAQIGAFKSQSSVGSSFGKLISSLSYFGNNNKNQQFMSNGQLRSTVIKAESILLIALIQLLQESIVSYVKAGLNLRRGYKNYESVWNEINKPGFNVPVDYHTQGGVEFGYGTCNLVLSFMPGKIIKIISAIGYKGNKELGLELLNASLKGRGIRSPLASLLFVTSYTMLTSFSPSTLGQDNIPKAEEYIRDALNQFPGSDFFTFFAGRNLRLKRDLDASTEAFISVNHNLKEGFGVELRRLCDYELGMNYAMTLQWEKAVECFDILATENYWSPAFFRYFQAACLEMQGKKKEAIDLYINVPNLSVRKFGGRTILVEQYVTRKTKNYIAKNFENTLLPGLEILLIWNSFACMKKEDLIRCLDIVNSKIESISKIDKQNPVDSQCMLRLIKGSILNQLHKFPEASQCFSWIFDHNDDIVDDKFIEPFAYWEMGVAAFLKGHLEKAKLSWEEAANFNGYEFEFRLAMRLHLSLMKIWMLAVGSIDFVLWKIFAVAEIAVIVDDFYFQDITKEDFKKNNFWSKFL
ncbi:3587_t:CDS:10 [Funneliformis mosseae]|uniref:3587_t:CDS:1 n=1 Tax=Funneliformis mosseae TaxID=27381 RepID=A0A9N9AT14_FUNMO|nr:3587_t:CDS:10 [Funneliformis mosseae]